MFKISSIVLVLLLVLFSSLISVSSVLSYFALACAILLCILFFIMTIQKYIDFNKKIDEDYYSIYLVELYNSGKITKKQLEDKDKHFYKRYKNEFKNVKYKYILAMIALIGLAILFISCLFII